MLLQGRHPYMKQWKQEKFFEIFKALPEIMFVLQIIVFFIYGIVDASVVTGATYMGADLYGLFQFRSAFMVWLVWMGIGLVATALQTLLMHVTMSPIILIVENTYHIRRQTSYIGPEPASELSTEQPVKPGGTWACSCGSVNKNSMDFCRTCFKERPSK